MRTAAGAADPRTGERVPQVILTRALARQTGGDLRYSVEAATVREAIDAVVREHPRLRRYLLNDNGTLRQHVNVFINDALVADRSRLTDPVSPNDAVHVLQAVSGGTLR